MCESADHYCWRRDFSDWLAVTLGFGREPGQASTTKKHDQLLKEWTDRDQTRSQKLTQRVRIGSQSHVVGLLGARVEF